MKIKMTLKRSSGFSLVELLITLAIMGILINWASANYSTSIQNAKVDAASEMVVKSVQFSQDYSRHLSVASALCAGTPEDKCNSNDWSKGWTLFHSGNNASGTLEAVRYFSPSLTGLNVTITGLKQSGKIIINGEGFILGLNTNAKVVVCDKNKGYHNVITLDKVNTTKTESFDSSTDSGQCNNG